MGDFKSKKKDLKSSKRIDIAYTFLIQMQRVNEEFSDLRLPNAVNAVNALECMAEPYATEKFVENIKGIAEARDKEFKTKGLNNEGYLEERKQRQLEQLEWEYVGKRYSEINKLLYAINMLDRKMTDWDALEEDEPAASSDVEVTELG